MKWNCRNFIKRKKNEESKRKEQDVFRKNQNGRSTDIYLLWDNVRIQRTKIQDNKKSPWALDRPKRRQKRKGEHRVAVMKLAGGETVEVYRNRKCRVCKAKVFQTVCCRKEKANICQEHCRKCEHYLDFMQRCIYREKTEEPEEENNEKEEK